MSLPLAAGSSWLSSMAAHLGAASRRVVGDSKGALEDLRTRRAISRLDSTQYPESDFLIVPAEVAADVEPTRFVTSESSVDVGVLHRWMSAAWVEKRFWRALEGAARGRDVSVLPLSISALGESFRALVLTDAPALVAQLSRLVELDPNIVEGVPLDARIVATLAGRNARDDRFLCTSLADATLLSSGWYSGPARIVEEALGVGFPCLAFARSSARWAVPATVAHVALERRDVHAKSTAAASSGETSATVALVGGAWDDRLNAAWSSSRGGGTATFLSDGPLWLQKRSDGVYCAPPLTGCRLPLRVLHLPDAAPVIAQMKERLLFVNAGRTESGLPWWDERGDPVPSGLLDWSGFPCRPNAQRRASHVDASVIVPYELLQNTPPSKEGVRLDALVFFVEVHTPSSLLIEAGTYADGIALAVGFDAVAGHLHDPLALRSFPGDASLGLSSWLKLASDGTAPRVFVCTVPRHSAGRLDAIPPHSVLGHVGAALAGHRGVVRGALGVVHASAGHGRALEPAPIIDALGRALDELGSRCPPDLRRAYQGLVASVAASTNRGR